MDVISIGSLNASIVHPREVLKPAIENSAASIILVHNHPSGDPTPSREDTEFTKRMAKCGELIGIQHLDHLVIGDGSYVSLRTKERCELHFGKRCSSVVIAGSEAGSVYG